MDILKKINKMRIDRGWSIYRLSTESGVSQSTLTNMFNRETLPSITTLECISSAFGITMSEFFLDESDGKNCDELEILALYRSSPDNVKSSILNLLRAISGKNKS